MGVIPMKKVEILIHNSHVDEVLRVVQKYTAVEFIQASKSAPVALSAEVKPVGEAWEHTLPRLQQVITFLDAYAPHRTVYDKLRNGTTIDILESNIASESEKIASVLPVIEDVEKLHAELTVVKEKIRQAEDEVALLREWKDLSIQLNQLETAHTRTMCFRYKDLPTVDQESMVAAVERRLATAGVSAVTMAVGSLGVAVTFLRSGATTNAVRNYVKELFYEEVILPTVPRTAAEHIKILTQDIATWTEQEAVLHAQAEQAAKEQLHDLCIVSDVLRWDKDRAAIADSKTSTTTTSSYVGWADADVLPQIESELKSENLLYVLQEVAIAEDEVPPVEIRNNRFIAPFEVVTRLYGLPGYRDIDPTVFLAGFFFLFFGLSLTDVGYGVFLMIAALLMLFVMKLSKVVRQFATLLFLMGASSSLVGLLFGGYLGVDPSSLPAALQAIQQFDPIANPLPVFYLALGLGVVQVMFGMVLKIYSDARNNELLKGVLDQGPWLALFVSLILYGVATTEYAFTGYQDEMLLLVYGSLIAIVVSSGRLGKTVFQKIQYSLLSLYQSIGYFSDILSYSRLLALGLATTALAFAVNLIADIVRDAVPYLGTLLAIMVLIVGHAFTLAVNTLGAFIHSARLQFVEFFGKFITGTGKVFKPLTRHSAYVAVVDDGALRK